MMMVEIVGLWQKVMQYWSWGGGAGWRVSANHHMFLRAVGENKENYGALIKQLVIIKIM